MLYHSFWAGRETRPPAIAFAHKYRANAMPLTAREMIERYRNAICHGKTMMPQDGSPAQWTLIAHIREGMLSFLGGYFGTKAERVEKPRPPEVDSRTVRTYVRETDAPLKKGSCVTTCAGQTPKAAIDGRQHRRSVTKREGVPHITWDIESDQHIYFPERQV